MKVQRGIAHGKLPKKNIPVESTIKEVDRRQHRSFKAYCFCGRKLCDTTPQDVWNGIQPRCKKCEDF